MLMSAEPKGCVTWFIYFLDLLWVRYNCDKFHYCRIYVTDFRQGGHPWAAPKKPILNRVKDTEAAVKNKLKILLSALRGFNFTIILVLVFKKIESKYKIKFDNFYSSSKAEIIIKETDIKNAFKSIYSIIISNLKIFRKRFRPDCWFSYWS